MLYRSIRFARSTARSAERRISTMEEEKDGVRPNWKPVLDLAIQILAEESKDLEIACYLIEALVRMHGFAGLHEGFRLCRLLVEHYWDELYPRPDADGLPTRIAPLMGLNGEGTEGTLIIPLLNVPLTSSASIGDFACSHHDQAVTLERIADPKTKARRVDQGAVSLKTFLEAVSDTPNAFYVALDQHIRGSLEEFQQLDRPARQSVWRSCTSFLQHQERPPSLPRGGLAGCGRSNQAGFDSGCGPSWASSVVQRQRSRDIRARRVSIRLTNSTTRSWRARRRLDWRRESRRGTMRY